MSQGRTQAGFGGGGGVVEAGETFIGKEPGVVKHPRTRGGSHGMKMVTFVDPGTKRAKSNVVDDLKKTTLIPILQEHIAPETQVMTDEANPA